MMQVIEMTHSEKVEMYQMIEKDRLIEMLIEANNVINRLTEVKNLRIADVSGRSELLIALQNIEKICDNQNPTHEEIWRIAYGAINSQ